MKKDNFLFCRFGGIGDAMILTAVAQAIKKTFPKDTVDLAVREGQEIIFNNLDCYDKVYPIKRMPHPYSGMNCVKTRNGWESLEKRKEKYSVVIDYVNSIENNSMHHNQAKNLGEWMQSQNSNFVNWIDMSFGWAKLDPTKFSGEEKRPIYKVEENERKWATDKLADLPRPIIAVNTFASSRARSYFDTMPLIKDLISEIKGCTVLYWVGNAWQVIVDGGDKILCQEPTIRESASIIEQVDCFVCADSGFSHIAEAMGVESVGFYTTVPAWTRNKYYKHSHDIQIDLPCSPCFTLHSQCPLNRQRALESLNKRESEVFSFANSGAPIELAVSRLNTTPDKLQQELQAINMKLDSLASVTPDCLASITCDMIVDKVKEALDAKKINSSD